MAICPPEPITPEPISPHLPFADMLIDKEDALQTSNFGQLVDYLQIGIASAEENIMALAAKAIGRLSQVGQGTSLNDVVSVQISQALDTFSTAARREDPTRRLAAALVLVECTGHAPGLFSVYLNKFLDVLWAALTDENQAIRGPR